MKFIHGILLHVANILAIVIITFYVWYYYNPFMNYLSNPLTRILIFVLAVTALAGNEISLIRLANANRKEQTEETEEGSRRKRTRRRRNSEAEVSASTEIQLEDI